MSMSEASRSGSTAVLPFPPAQLRQALNRARRGAAPTRREPRPAGARPPRAVSRDSSASCCSSSARLASTRSTMRSSVATISRDEHLQRLRIPLGRCELGGNKLRGQAVDEALALLGRQPLPQLLRAGRAGRPGRRGRARSAWAQAGEQVARWQAPRGRTHEACRMNLR
jgi:hypothetical protein